MSNPRDRPEYTAAHASERLGCSVAQLARFEQTGQLAVRREQRGKKMRVFYDAAMVETLYEGGWRSRKKKKRKGAESVEVQRLRDETAGKVFRAFDLGWDCKMVTRELEVHPDVVTELWQRYRADPNGVTPEEAERRAEEEERRAQLAHDRRMRAEVERVKKEGKWS